MSTLTSGCIHTSGGQRQNIITTSEWLLPVSLNKVTTYHHWKVCHKLKYTHPFTHASWPQCLHHFTSTWHCFWAHKNALIISHEGDSQPFYKNTLLKLGVWQQVQHVPPVQNDVHIWRSGRWDIEYSYWFIWLSYLCGLKWSFFHPFLRNYLQFTGQKV